MRVGAPRLSAWLACAIAFAVLAGCVPRAPGAVRPAADGAAGGRAAVILATTTSTRDSGLLDALLPAFERRSGYRVKTVAVGSGAALAMGERGEADVLLTHAPDAERKLVEAGAVTSRRLVTHNEFVVVGPASDPAGIRGGRSAAAAFRKVREKEARFVSRGDDSGTHMLELQLWKQAGLEAAGPGYIRSGSGMAETLRIASERGAYTLTDRATYLAHRKTLSLEVLLQGDPLLRNLYHVMEVNPTKFATVNAAGARAFADFLLSDEGQDIIARFGVDRFGEPLFVPAAGKREEDLAD